MRLKNVVIVVNDIEKSKRFYKELFGLNVTLDGDENVMLTEGLVLQEANIWKQSVGTELYSKNNHMELYFEESDIEGLVTRLDSYDEKIEYVTELTETSRGQKLVRFYDLDGDLIEVRSPMKR